MTVPANPKIYHITHVRNLPQILLQSRLWSDAERLARGFDCELVGMSEIKRRRLEELPVTCFPSTKVGEYVPFYFCPRSIMLYILHRGNHPELTYGGGQTPILHLEADLLRTVQWCDQHQVPWAFSKSNAGARYADFYNSLPNLGEVNWVAVGATDFRDARIKEGKQAEFLVYSSLPWELVETIGVIDNNIAEGVSRALKSFAHRPQVTVKRDWYF